MDDEDDDLIEPMNFTDACGRAILEMIIVPLRDEFPRDIKTSWPIETPYTFSYEIDYTCAIITINTKEDNILGEFDIVIRVYDGNLSISYPVHRTVVNQQYRHMGTVNKKIPIANPNVHDEALNLIRALIKAVKL